MDKPVLLTGGSGFLGSAIESEFNSNNIKLKTLGRSSDNDYSIDITKPFKIDETFDTVIHSAAKAHIVPKNKTEEDEFYTVNLTGTKNLLDSFTVLPKHFVFISTVAVYGLESGENIKETNDLAAKDPYGRSKIQAEEIVKKWGDDNRVKTTILRLPLVYGSNTKGNLKKMIDSIRSGLFFNIDGGKAKKSIVFANDIAIFIPKIIKTGGIYNLTDGENPSFYEISSEIAKKLHKKPPISIPSWFIMPLAIMGDIISFLPINTSTLKKMTSSLTFNDDLAREKHWQSRSVIEVIKNDKNLN